MQATTRRGGAALRALCGLTLQRTQHTAGIAVMGNQVSGGAGAAATQRRLASGWGAALAPHQQRLPGLLLPSSALAASATHRRHLWVSTPLGAEATTPAAAAPAAPPSPSPSSSASAPTPGPGAGLSRADELFGVENLEEMEDATLASNSWAEDQYESDDEELRIKGSSLSIEVNLNNVDLACRRLKRALVMEGIEETQERNKFYVKPAVRRVQMLEDRERRHAKRKLRRKIKWFLDRRERFQRCCKCDAPKAKGTQPDLAGGRHPHDRALRSAP